MDWSGIQHVAVIMPTWIGDICMATPALRMLRHRMPGGGTITAIVRPGKATIIDGLETVDHMLELEPSGLLGPWRCGRALAKSGADAVLILPGSFRSGVVARVSGIRHRIGYARDGRGWLLTHPVKQPDRSTPTPQIQWYAGLVDDGPAPPPELRVADADRAEAAEILRSVDASGWAVIVPGAANRPDKRWPADHFASLVDRLQMQVGLACVLAGSPSEQSITSDIAARASVPCIDLAGMGASLGALKAVIDDARVVVSNDTGPRHIAIALGTPVVSLFGPTDHRWTALDCEHERRLLAEPFLPEKLTADHHAAACGMDRICVADVVHAACSLLQHRHGPPTIRSAS